MKPDERLSSLIKYYIWSSFVYFVVFTLFSLKPFLYINLLFSISKRLRGCNLIGKVPDF